MSRTRRRPSRRRQRAKRSTQGDAADGGATSDSPEDFHRQQITWLAEQGFKAAESLPWQRFDRHLRPLADIARRLVAIKALAAWVCVPADQMATKLIQAGVGANRLGPYLTADERQILQTGRQEAAEQFADTIGWKFENAWPLAWILGYEHPPERDGAMLKGAAIRELLFAFTPSLAINIDEQLEDWIGGRPRPELQEVLRLEHTFYCMHNAVRSAQLGGNAVPEGFHPIINGGVVHERRHALSWALSPGIDWESTDLST